MHDDQNPPDAGLPEPAPETEARPAAEPVTAGFVFTGTTDEYFRIWIVNMCLSLVTLGIYSAWAKVRLTQYIRAHTTLDGMPLHLRRQSHGHPARPHRRRDRVRRLDRPGIRGAPGPARAAVAAGVRRALADRCLAAVQRPRDHLPQRRLHVRRPLRRRLRLLHRGTGTVGVHALPAHPLGRLPPACLAGSAHQLGRPAPGDARHQCRLLRGAPARHLRGRRGDHPVRGRHRPGGDRQE
jgi:hypothetical protein